MVRVGVADYLLVDLVVVICVVIVWMLLIMVV